MSTELATRNESSLAPTTMDGAINFAEMAAKCDLLPDHLKSKPANCLRVVMQSSKWGMDFFGVADCTSLIHGKLMYEGKLVSAVINARGNLKSRLNYKFTGEGVNRKLTVIGTLKGEDDPRDIELTFKQAKEINKNGQVDKNPDQQMCYIGARIWARRHMPELMLGVYTPDEDISNSEDEDGLAASPKRPTPPKKNKGAAAAMSEKREMKPAEKIEEEEAPKEEKPEPKPKEKPAEKKAEPADADEPKKEEGPEDVAGSEIVDDDQGDDAKPADKGDAPAKKEAEKKPAPAKEMKAGQEITGIFAIEDFKDVEDKSGKPIKTLQIRGDEYAGVAYSRDVKNPHLSEKGMAELSLKGQPTKSGDRVICLITKADEAVNF